MNSTFVMMAIRYPLKGRSMAKRQPLATLDELLVNSLEKDLLDVNGILARHRQRLDRDYLESWAQRLSDEAQDARIWNTPQSLLTA